MHGPVALPDPGHPSARAGDLRLSVIVPFAPHESAGDALLEQLRGLPADCEIIVVRAGEPGSHPPAAQGNRDPRRRQLTAPPGRASQMNAGARAARGRWLWFLHADSRLHPRTLPALHAFLARHHDALGYFDLRYADDGPALTRLNALGANLRARWLGMPFGDQGLVLPAAWFARLGGYDEQAPYGEDHLLVWQARHAGLPLRRLRAPLTSSARKYAREGWLKVTARHWRLTLRQAWPEWRAARRRRARTAAIRGPEAPPEP
ncbi:TIGR04283 family arsenosugar biosynthesis glycosyltransferase [Dokdonella sp.]|uniref:TIGR04283 family arsenosugar biosynthesis glycosyltransferase n=1 Tax=Dokdonella sp. TaxID=2291710 RepID=UPI0031C80F3C|nr:TIGR04283 family arsenosugar biosynthesis glycosyltransferase [Dokdonella sp.]